MRWFRPSRQSRDPEPPQADAPTNDGAGPLDAEAGAPEVETPDMLVDKILAGAVYPNIDVLFDLCGPEETAARLGGVFGDESRSSIVLDVLGFFQTKGIDWRQYQTERTGEILRTIFNDVASSGDVMRLIYRFELKGLDWRECATERTVDMLARHMRRYGMYREYDGYTPFAEVRLKELYDHGYLQEAIRRYDGTLLYKGSMIESGSGDDTYRDIWDDTYFRV